MLPFTTVLRQFKNILIQCASWWLLWAEHDGGWQEGPASIAACEDGWWGRAGHCHLWWELTCREDSQKLAIFSVYNIYMITCGLWPASTLSNIIYQMMLLNNFKRSMCNNITRNGQGMENADVDISVMMIVPLSHGGIVFHLREDLWTIYRSDEDQNLKILKFYAKLCEIHSATRAHCQTFWNQIFGGNFNLTILFSIAAHYEL